MPAMKVFALCFTAILAQDQPDDIYDLDHVYDDSADYDGADLIQPKKLNQTDQVDEIDTSLNFDRKGTFNEKVFDRPNKNKQQEPIQHADFNTAIDELNQLGTNEAKGQNEGGRTSYSSGNTGSTSLGYSDSGSTTTTAATAPISCWTCRNAYSYEQCQTAGYLVTCQPNQTACELEVRKRNNHVIQVNTGCKQALACENNKSQNFAQSDPAHTQCRPESGYDHSVCRQCCYDDSCVSSPDFWQPGSRDDWNF